MTCSDTNFEDLEWTAFRYVSGDLSGSEVESFELLLADDVDAAMAVARTVQVVQAIQRTKPPVEHVRQRATVASRRPDARWRNRVMVGMAAVCVLFVALMAFESKVPQSDSIGRLDANSSNSLATYSAAPDAELVSFWVNSASETEAVLSETPPTADVLEVPDWLLAAVDVEEAASESVRDERPSHN